MHARRLMLAAIGAAAVLGSALPAHADWDGDDGWRRRGWREHEWREHEWREHAWRRHEWQERYYGRPAYVVPNVPTYYPPPPVYYAPPPAYYGVPGASFGFRIR